MDAAIRTERLYAQVSLQRQDIIHRFGINRHTLNDLITAHTNGLSFPQYINRIRIEEAKHLLDSQPAMTFTAIAEAVGFTPANLREQFKRHYGMTPGEYRKNL
ncbi:MAG: AraC family transcriptional regulator [Prevotella sp.]|nr:AraC family transcriptional regulator [Prevotella sp.]